MFSSVVKIVSRVHRDVRHSLVLRELDRLYLKASILDSSNIHDLHWLGAVRFFQGRLSEANSLLDKTYAIDAVHVHTPLEIYEWVQNTYDDLTAQSYIDFFIANRNANIFKQIDIYVDHLRTTRYVEYPLAVNIETLALCNAACTFCQYPELLRKGDKMPTKLVEKIFCDLEELPKDLPFSITLAGVSEPLLDKRIFEFIEQLNIRVPQAYIGINTNGAPLTKRVLDRLLDLKVHSLSISMNDHRKTEYEATMKISYDRTLKVLDMLESRKAAGEIPFAVGITRAGDGSVNDLKFIEWAKRTYPNCSNYFTPEFVWVGEQSILPLAPKAGCTHWFDLTIRSTGQVAFCCIDGHIKSPHGDVKHENILAIYNKDSLRSLRTNSVKRPDVAQCQSCTSG